MIKSSIDMSESPMMFLFNNRLQTDMSFFNLILQVVAHFFPKKKLAHRVYY